MKEVTDRMHSYRECVRHVWNTHFRMEGERQPDWDLRDQFCDAALILFQALVLRGLDIADSTLLADYRGDQEPLMFLRLEVEPVSTILVNRTGAGAYWDDPVTRIERGDCDLRFIQFFDWSDLDFRDFAFYRVRVVGSSRYPHLVGRDALLPVTSSVKVIYEHASQQAAAAAERREQSG
jgi:hypothetical protein